jgi:hypothetical protein
VYNVLESYIVRIGIMISFLLWNLHKKELLPTISKIVRLYGIDVLILIESCEEISKVLLTLNHSVRGNLFDHPFTNCDHVQIFTKFPATFMRPVHESGRYTIRHLQLPGLMDLIIVAAHFISKVNASADSQTSEMIEFAHDIRNVEMQFGHLRTLVTGDLNMNPFETGVVTANGLHGIMERNIVKKRFRVIQGRSYDYFYNPMWNLLGDCTNGPPGTYYESRAEMVNYFWNMYDQVLIRSELLPVFDNKYLKIISSIEEESLLNENGIPDAMKYSDHLPITFKLIL